MGLVMWVGGGVMGRNDDVLGSEEEVVVMWTLELGDSVTILGNCICYYNGDGTETCSFILRGPKLVPAC